MLMQLILLLQQWRIYSSVAQFLGCNMKALGSEYTLQMTAADSESLLSTFTTD
jgi:hypothetical protein